MRTMNFVVNAMLNTQMIGDCFFCCQVESKMNVVRSESKDWFLGIAEEVLKSFMDVVDELI